jgi:hypothetical protein
MMKKVIAIILIVMCAMVSVFARPTGRYETSGEQRVRFVPLGICMETGSRALAAFQFELKALSGDVEIVGVEGGIHPAYKEPPYYDPAALANDRIIIAAFNTGSDLPTGHTRVATLHLRIAGDAEPEYELKLIVAADAEGSEIPAEITFAEGE